MEQGTVRAWEDQRQGPGRGSQEEMNCLSSLWPGLLSVGPGVCSREQALAGLERAQISCVSLPYSSENRCITRIFFPRDSRDQTGRRGTVEPVGGCWPVSVSVCVSVWGYKWSQEEVFVVLPHGKRLVCRSGVAESPGDIYLSSTTSREVSPQLCFQLQT